MIGACAAPTGATTPLIIVMTYRFSVGMCACAIMTLDPENSASKRLGAPISAACARLPSGPPKGGVRRNFGGQLLRETEKIEPLRRKGRTKTLRNIPERAEKRGQQASPFLAEPWPLPCRLLFDLTQQPLRRRIRTPRASR